MTVTDKRRIDPQTGEVRRTVSGPPSGPAPGASAGRRVGGSGCRARPPTCSGVQADFANYRKRGA